ncbi:hypothetical protein LXL04_019159 [Taraxacum kok-saghyz]
MVELGVEKELVVVSEIRFEGGLRNLLAPLNGQKIEQPIVFFVAVRCPGHVRPRNYHSTSTRGGVHARGSCPRRHHDASVLPTLIGLIQSLCESKRLQSADYIYKALQKKR